MDPKEYKDYHESFMMNNNGTSAVNVFSIIMPQFLSVLCVTQFCTLTTINATISPFVRYLIEFGIIIGSVILTVTVLNDFLTPILFSYAVVVITITASRTWGKWHLEPFIQIPAKRPEYIDIVRAITAYITSVAILAVDFEIFPRNLAKTETFGYGLMDVGVGLYVISNAIISPYKEHAEMLTWLKFKKELIGCTPLIFLGIIRFWITTEINYQQHVSEYGVHWNFFITLAFVKLFGTIIMGFMGKSSNAKYGAIIILCIHEMLLESGLAKYVLNDEVKRDSFINSNREGIVSIAGYLGLYLGSVYMGSLMRHEEEFIRPKKLIKQVLRMGLFAVFCWKLLFVCETMFGVSRRLANMGYVFWMLSIDSTYFTLAMIHEMLVYFMKFEQNNSKDKSLNENSGYLPILINAINYNGLVYFIVANLLTGMVNLIFQTFLQDVVTSLFILVTYMFLLSSFVVFLYLNRIKLKVW